MGKLRLALAAFAVLVAQSAPALDLTIGADDLRIESRGDGGYHLYIRKKPDIAAVLLTETTKDPNRVADNYAYRAAEWNPFNGDEVRLLDGKPIPKESRLFSLIDSTPEPDARFGLAFHIFIPYVLLYGYSWSRNGEIYVADGTFVNLRAFAKPYGDYSGPFRDNPYAIRMSQKRSPVPAPQEGGTAPSGEDRSGYAPDTVSAFTKIADRGGGELVWSSGEADLPERIEAILEREKGGSLDLVICVDTTESMENDIDAVKRDLPGILRERIAGFSRVRIGIVLYKDYFFEYVTMAYDFSDDLSKITKELDSIRPFGGADLPEAVYEALYAAVTGFPWAAEKRLVILVGDAPPHPVPRGKVKAEDVEREAKKRDIRIDVIILPN